MLSKNQLRTKEMKSDNTPQINPIFSRVPAAFHISRKSIHMQKFLLCFIVAISSKLFACAIKTQASLRIFLPLLSEPPQTWLLRLPHTRLDIRAFQAAASLLLLPIYVGFFLLSVHQYRLLLQYFNSVF